MKCGSTIRLEYIDLCKLVAMFLVTWAHCAQQISGNTFPDMLLTNDVFISINMPIFMIASGMVVDLNKMRQKTAKDYFSSRFWRLIVPMTSWYFLLYLVRYPGHVDYWDAYWYLSALFVCLVTIKLLTYIFSETRQVMFYSILILSVMSLHVFERSFFMMPFLWVGIWLKGTIDKIDMKRSVVLLIIYACLYFFWDVDYSIYISPFNIMNVTPYMFFCLFYRFVIGSVGGVAFIAVLRQLFYSNFHDSLNRFSKYGNYTLVFYTMSFVLNSFLARVLWHFDEVYITEKGLLDMISFLITILMMMFMYYFQIAIEKTPVLSRFLLGISHHGRRDDRFQNHLK